MNSSAWTITALIVGLVVMLLGPLFVGSYATTIVWNDDQARQFSKAAADLHAASYGAGHAHDPARPHSHQSPPPDDPTLVAARAAFNEQQAKLDAAHSRQYWLPIIIRGVGGVIAGLGVCGYLISQKQANKPHHHRAEKAHHK